MPKLPLFSVPCRNCQLETLSVAAIFVFVFFIFYTPPLPTFYHSFLLSLCFCCRPFLGVELWDVDSKGARGDAPQTHHLQEGTRRTRRACYKVRETKLFLYNCILKLFSPHNNFLCLFLISFFYKFYVGLKFPNCSNLMNGTKVSKVCYLDIIIFNILYNGV